MIPQSTVEQNNRTEQKHNIILLLLEILNIKIVLHCKEQFVLQCSIV